MKQLTLPVRMDFYWMATKDSVVKQMKTGCVCGEGAANGVESHPHAKLLNVEILEHH
jgi:hypothetical protein